jgi:hypothetical protein
MLKSGLLTDGRTISYKFEQVDIIHNGRKMEHYKHQVNGALLHARDSRHRRVERTPWTWTHTVLQESPGCRAASTAKSVTLGSTCA